MIKTIKRCSAWTWVLDLNLVLSLFHKSRICFMENAQHFIKRYQYFSRVIYRHPKAWMRFSTLRDNLINKIDLYNLCTRLSVDIYFIISFIKPIQVYLFSCFTLCNLHACLHIGKEWRQNTTYVVVASTHSPWQHYNINKLNF